MRQVAILASGSGSNAENLILEMAKLSNELSLAFVLTDNPSAKVIERCYRLNVPVRIIPRSINEKKLAHEEKILKCLKDESVEWVLLAGYMRILSNKFLKEFYDPILGESRVINIHPSLLPKHKGRDGYLKTFNSNDKEGGATVHFVDSGIDTGRIISQRSFNREPEDSFASFKERGMNLEHLLYREALHRLVNGDIL